MRIDFSKPSNDISKEHSRQTEENKILLDREKESACLLKEFPRRKGCLLCLAEELNEAFLHRGINYLQRDICGHIQTAVKPPPDYPFHKGSPYSFASIYPGLEEKEYQSRKERIYRPKLEWALSCHGELGLTEREMLSMKWFELGCGCGYFLDALRDRGIERIYGIEKNPELVQRANSILGNDTVKQVKGSLTEGIKNFSADIYVAFFVLEHIEDTKAFFDILRDKPEGTVFYFSVPTFSFSALLESSFDMVFARNLDSAVHTQLYTDKSIKYCLESAGYEMAAQWIFGQDAMDFLRFLRIYLEDKYEKSFLENNLNKLGDILEPLQNILDRAFFSDSRHILAVKR